MQKRGFDAVVVGSGLTGWPHPFAMARFGSRDLLPVTMLANRYFRTTQMRGLVAGLAAQGIA